MDTLLGSNKPKNFSNIVHAYKPFITEGLPEITFAYDHIDHSSVPFVSTSLNNSSDQGKEVS